MLKNTREKGKSLNSLVSDYCIIDIETTGLDPNYCEIIELASVKVRNNEIVDSFHSLVKPDEEIDEFITKLTGISNEDVADAPKINDVLPSFIEFVSNDIVTAHNAHFDINFIYDNCLNIFKRPFKNDFIDTLKLSRRYIKNLSMHKLDFLAKNLGIENNNYHRALNDCYVTFELYKILQQKELELLDNVKFFDEYSNKKVLITGNLQYASINFLKEYFAKCNSIIVEEYSTDIDFIIQGYQFSYDEEYQKYFNSENHSHIWGIYEVAFLHNIGLEFGQRKKIDIKNITAETDNFDEEHLLFGKTCVITGTLENLTRAEAMQIIVNYGGINATTVTKNTNFLILGNNDFNPKLKGEKSRKLLKAEDIKLKGGDIEIISENVFYDLIDQK